MLDTVPDKVLICSKETNDDVQAKPIYNNRQMVQFFGQNFVIAESTKSKQPIISQDGKKKKTRRLSAFKRRLFTQRKNLMDKERNRNDSPPNLNDGPTDRLSPRNNFQ